MNKTEKELTLKALVSYAKELAFDPTADLREYNQVEIGEAKSLYLSLGGEESLFLTDNLSPVIDFVRRVSDLTLDGEVDPYGDGEPFVMAVEDNQETLTSLIEEARRLVPQTPAPAPDATVENHGSIYTLKLESDAAKTWADENLPQDAQRIGTSGIVIEHRYISDIVAGMRGDGLVVK